MCCNKYNHKLSVLSSSLAFLLSLIMAHADAQTGDIKCPQMQGVTPLSHVIVFDGPPEEMASLKPDRSTGSGKNEKAVWQLGYIYEAGRKVYLVCQYKSLEDIIVKAEKKLDSCTYRARADKRPIELVCK